MRTGIMLILASISMFIMGCSTPRLTPDPKMKYFYEITEGDDVEISWNFLNAHRVKVDGYEGSFLPEGSITEQPLKSREYKITAFKGFSDSLVWTVYVDVIAKISSDEVRTGDFVLKEHFENPSYEESEFINGVIDEKNSTGPTELRIVRVNKDDKTGIASINALLLDKLGNFVSGYGYKKDSVIWNSTNTCGEISANYSRLEFNEQSSAKNKENVDFAVLIDNSIFSMNDSLKSTLKYFISGMSPQDRIMISTFNQNYSSIIGFMSPELALYEFESSFILPKKSGFNGSFNALDNALDALNSGVNKNRAVVLVTYSNDNATFNKTIEDVIQKAVLNNTAVFVIAIGDFVDSREYRDLSSTTGAKYYLLLSDETHKLGTVMSEILFTYRNSYQVVLPARRLNNKCELTKSEISFSDLKNNLSTTIYYPEKYSAEKAKTVIAAGFDEVSLTISGNYYENLNIIASQVKAIDANYMIIGYSYDEGNEEVSKNFSIMRAEAVKDYFVSKGVNPGKLIVQSAAPDFAMFRNTNDEQLLRLNRRVEISEYKVPDVKEYQIACELLPTETDAEQAVVKWEKRGYRSYYIRKTNGYQVLLWDFKDRADAENKAAEISLKYKMNANIE